MILVSEIWDDTKVIFGHCLEVRLFRQLTDSIELLSNKGETDALKGYVDMCVDGGCVTTPREVETILAVNICGKPALGRDVLFSFHLNGPGDRGCGCGWTWTDGGNWPTYRDLKCPAKLIAFLDSPEDAGKMLRVWGFDEQNRPLRTKIGETWEDGLRVPTIFGYAVPSSSDPLVSRITAIQKDETVANVRLSSFDGSSTTGTLLGIYEPGETKPEYRRIRICPSGPWVTIAYRKRTYEIRSVHDRILLSSRPALLMAMRALKFYTDGDLANGQAYEANATRLLTERESSLTGPPSLTIQVDDRNSISDKFDYLD